MSFKGKTVFITGASRGIGLAIGKKLAQEGANIVIAAKTDTPNPKLPGTIHSAAAEIEAAGGQALAVMCDIRFEENVQEAVNQAVARFGGIDILINNASAISLTGTLQTDMKRYDLMHNINTRGTFLVSKTCLPFLLKAENPHVLNLSPPLSMKTHWFENHTAYTMAKYGMSMCVLGMAGEFKGKVAFNALWPRTAIATAAVQNILGGDHMVKHSRTTEILSDAAYFILKRDAKTCTGNFFIDDELLATEGITDLSGYAVTPGMKDSELFMDFFVD
jgi:citronellol/citronellal dehydrogenase